MLMDQITEIFSHMIGIFHTTLEEERMRDVYEKFKALKEADPDNDPLAGPPIEFSTKYTLEGFSPGMRYVDQAPINPTEDIASPFYLGAQYPIYNLSVIVSPIPTAPTFYSQFWGTGRPELILEPAGSVAVITVQTSYLSDNDTIMMGDGTTLFTDRSEMIEQQLQLEVIAAAIASPVESDIITPGEDAAEDAITLHAQLAQAEASTLTGVSSTLAHGSDVIGMRVNGEIVEDFPDLKALMPEYHQTEEDESEDVDQTTDDTADDTGAVVNPEDGSSIGVQDPDHEFPDPFEGMDTDSSDDGFSGYFDHSEGGSLIVTGGNTLLNEVAINSAWLDAPVFSVMGDVVNLDVIIQVNVLMDLDYGTMADLVSSTAMNAAAISIEATTPAPTEETGEPIADDETEDTSLPTNWVVTRIEGDLIQFNQTIQYNFVTDFDTAEIVLEQNDTYIAMGDNSVLNLASLSELGYGFDLIMIGGNMISVNWISQVNVMLDNDTVTVSGGAPAGIGGSDNLLFNGATINSIGVDAYGEMAEHFDAAGKKMAEGGTELDSDVAQDSVFEGVELLRVLYIEGDLTTINWIDQTNILGDSDQVHLAMENAELATGTTATVTAGSNATINVATINEYGIDSEVQVGGDVYDDALLYQAELIDTDAAPTGVDLPALASEAVVFLADGMVTGDDNANTDIPITATANENIDTPDVMQTMLA